MKKILIFAFVLAIQILLCLPVHSESVNDNRYCVYRSSSDFTADEIDLDAFKEEFSKDNEGIFASLGKDKLTFEKKAEYSSEDAAKAMNKLLDNDNIYKYVTAVRIFGDTPLESYRDKNPNKLRIFNKTSLMFIFSKTLKKARIRYLHLEETPITSGIMGVPFNVTVGDVLKWIKENKFKFEDFLNRDTVLRSCGMTEDTIKEFNKSELVQSTNQNTKFILKFVSESVTDAIALQRKEFLSAPVFAYNGEHIFWILPFSNRGDKLSKELYVMVVNVGNDVGNEERISIYFCYDDTGSLKSFACGLVSNKDDIFDALSEKYGGSVKIVYDGDYKFNGYDNEYDEDEFVEWNKIIYSGLNYILSNKFRHGIFFDDSVGIKFFTGNIFMINDGRIIYYEPILYNKFLEKIDELIKEENNEKEKKEQMDIEERKNRLKV
ncbi:MAG: hypothetical protein M0Q46_05545 [Endomicrobiales bacterium]|nr:hypothetical protein [Endomicrobiales bacterium]